MPKRSRTGRPVRSAASQSRKDMRWVGRELANVNVRKPDLKRVGAYLKAQTPNEDTNFFYGPSWRKASLVQKANRQEDFYVGRGKYNILRTLGRGIRKAAKFVAPYAKAAARDAAMAYLGSGSYKPNTNVLFENSSDTPMRVSSLHDETETMVITHREYIGDVIAPTTTGFHNKSYQLNPGLAEVFPWLSQVAINYDEYQWDQLVFEYHSTVDSSTVSNGQTGTVIVATQYNVDNQTFGSKDTMLQYYGAQSGRLTEDLRHGVECDPAKLKGDGVKYVRSKPIDHTLEQLDDYDIGRTEMAIVNCPASFANQALGELWVYYTVRLMKPKIGANRSVGVQKFEGGATFIDSINDIFALDPPQGGQHSMFAKALNSLDCTVGRYNSNGEWGGGKWISIDFPPNFSGRVRIIERFEVAEGLSGNLNGTFYTSGNVRFVKNQYCHLAGDDNPTQVFSMHTATHAILIYEVDVTTATGGVVNRVNHTHSLALSNADANMQSHIEIMEIPNTSQSRQLDPPKFFGHEGTPVVL